MRRLLLPAAVVAVLLTGATASADVTGVSVTSEKDLGRFAGKPYREAALQIRGTAPGGPYSVPAVVTYPARAGDANGFALVEPYNTVPVWVPDPRLPSGPFAPGRGVLGDRYVFGRGNVHLALLWDKGAMEQRGEGTMSAGTDGYEVLRDAADLVRRPASMPYPPGYRRPPATPTVVATGYSQSSNLLRDYYLRGENIHEGLAFDGALLQTPNATCATPDAPITFFHCGGVIADPGRVLVVNTEADVEFAGFTERGSTAHYRVQEIAGVSHIPPDIFDVREAGQSEQNPASGGPAFRAAHRNLLRWMQGGRPPQSQYIELQDVPPEVIGGFPFVPPARDADGNPLGGIRLPHLPSRWHGKVAGAPLGAYTGLDRADPDWLNFLTGTFRPFPPERLRVLYPTHAAYVERVRRAANRLLALGQILPADRHAYVDAARREDPTG